MNSSFPSEKVKPFRLVKYFTFASLIVIFIGTISLSLLNTRWARNMQLRKSEEYALVLAENLNHQIFSQFIIPVAIKYGNVQLRNKEQFEHLDQVVRSTLHSFKVDMLHIYDKSDVVSYSFDPSVIGMENVGGTGFQNAVGGAPTSKLFQRGNFWEILLGFPKESKLITFAPIRAEKPLSRLSGPILGVLEITQDLSNDVQTISEFQIDILITCSAVMGILFLVLLLVVKRGESFFEKRAMERFKLKEELSHAQHLSTLGEMVAGISHEIRNPLGIILSSAEHLKKKIAKANIDMANPFPDIIIEEAGRLNTIITDFLNYARPRTPNRIPCSVSDIIDKNIAFLNSQIQEGNYTIEKIYRDAIPVLSADSEMLYQAFLNLFINAMDAMPEGGVIRVNIESDAQHEVVFISIEDEGDGIEDTLKNKVWDPFFTTKPKGTGLGLGIVKNIIESHNGSVHMTNRPVRGARVTVELPVNPDQRI